MRRFTLFLVGLFCTIGMAMAQRVIKGTVISAEDDQPVIGASVVVQGNAQRGVVTDLDGNFELSVPQSTKALVVSFIGYTTQTVSLAKGDRVRVVLVSDQKALDELVVMAYGVQRKSSLTGSATSVKSDKFANAKVESIDKALAGKVTGLRVTSVTGDAGASGDIQIRGIGSINGETSPLYVVDGIPVVSGNFGSDGLSANVLSTLNPDDIESMTVLKDAAAASLYGSRAANGVVVITTKKGSAGKTSFNLRFNQGWSTMATDSYKPMNAAQFNQYYKDALVGYFLNTNKALVPGSANYGDQATIAQAEADAQQEFVDSPILGPSTSETNWRDLIYDGGHNTEAQVSASGGSDKFRYFASLGLNDTKGIALLSNFKRYTSTINLDNKATKWLDLNFKTQVSYSEQTGRGDKGDQTQGIPTSSPLSLLFTSKPNEPLYGADGLFNPNANLNPKVKNAIMQLQPEMSLYERQVFRNISDVGARITFTDWLSFKTSNSVDYISSKILRRWSRNSTDGESVGGLGERTNNTLYTLTTSNVLSFNKDFADVHHVDGLLGFEAQKFNRLEEFFSAKSYPTDALPELINGQTDKAQSDKYGTYMQSYFGGLNYNYDNRYFLGASIRIDESSRLGKDKRQGTFYSLSGAWAFGREAWFKNKIVTDGKLRASFGTNGNLPIDYYASQGLYSISGAYGAGVASYLSQSENPTLGWEQSSNFNLGVDFTIASRFAFTLEYYSKYTTDLLLKQPIHYGTGLEEEYRNVGELSNRGFEFEFHGTDMLRTPVKWNADFSLATTKSVVEKLPGGDIITGDGNLYIYREGKDLHSFYLPTWHGVDPQSGLGMFLIDPEKPATSDNLTHIYTKAGRTIQQSAYPKLFGGLTNSFSYKGLTLSALVTYQFGGHLFDYPGYFFKSDGVRIGAFMPDSELVGNYWRQPGDKVDNPRPVLGQSFRSDRWSTRQIHSTDFIRLKELSLTYRVPESLYKRLGINNVDLSVVANNLFFFYSALGNKIEPEVALNGYRTTDTPLARSISFGINVGL